MIMASGRKISINDSCDSIFRTVGRRELNKTHTGAQRILDRICKADCSVLKEKFSGFVDLKHDI